MKGSSVRSAPPTLRAIFVWRADSTGLISHSLLLFCAWSFLVHLSFGLFWWCLSKSHEKKHIHMIHPKSLFFVWGLSVLLFHYLHVVVASPISLPHTATTHLKQKLLFEHWGLLKRRQSNDNRPTLSQRWKSRLSGHIAPPSSYMIFGGTYLTRWLPKNSNHILAVVGIGCVVYRQCSRSEPLRRATYFWRQAAPIVAHYKFTKFWLTLQNANAAKRDAVYNELHNKYAEPALDLILDLKGLYVKLGQVLSARPDFMPVQYTRVFTTLQDDVPSVSGMREVAMEELQKHCGESFHQYDDVEWDPVPLGSASIGQVHRAVLVRGKQRTTVAVKVMRPGSEDRFEHDFSVFRWLCRVAIPSWKSFLDAFHQQVMTEFDYRNEAISLNQVRENMKRSPYGKRVQIPFALTDLCCKNVLVMEMLHGKRLADAIREQFIVAWGGNETAATTFLQQRKEQVLTGNIADQHNPLDELGWPAKIRLWRLSKRCTGWIELLVKIHGHQIFCDGVWNGDPHFGNLLQLENGRLGLIDYGQTRRIDDELRKAFANIVVTIHDSESNTTGIASAMERAGFRLSDPSDHETMAHYGLLMFDSDVISEQKGYRIPQEYFSYLMEKNPLVEMPDSCCTYVRIECSRPIV